MVTSLRSFDVGEHPSKMLRCDQRNDQGCEHQTEQAENAHGPEVGGRGRSMNVSMADGVHRFSSPKHRSFLEWSPRGLPFGPRLPDISRCEDYYDHRYSCEQAQLCPHVVGQAVASVVALHWKITSFRTRSIGVILKQDAHEPKAH